MNDRVITIKGTDPISNLPITEKMEFDSTAMKDSTIFKLMLCNFDFGDNYTVEFKKL